MKVVLGVDPGIVHTGWAVLVDGKTKGHGLIEIHGLNWINCIPIILSQLKTKVINKWEIDCAAVENVSWYRKSNKIILPLAHMAGAIIGFLMANTIVTYVLTSQMKAPKRWPDKWSEHEKDAANLALAGFKHEIALNVDAVSSRKKHLAAFKRRLSVTDGAPGNA